MAIHPALEAVTEAIRTRSLGPRRTYLSRIQLATDTGNARGTMSCGNLAHGIAAADTEDKARMIGAAAPNLGIITAYNDMLSAHQPYGVYPNQIKLAAREVGATAQVAGGVPAMCDGVTQGRSGMDLSLFSRDLIAMSTAVGLSHDLFDAGLYLGVCDKIVPGMLIGALSFGHLPAVFIPAGPMESGLPNHEKARVRGLYAEGKIGREELLEAETKSYHSAGTCTFYGTANSNQMMMEFLGLMLPGSAFINPSMPLRQEMTRAAVHRAAAITAKGEEFIPLGHVIDERSVVNAVVGLLATGGSTNHTLHLVAIARAAGIVLTWDDIAALSEIVPLLARVYPNGDADVNHFQAAGGLNFVIRELLSAGLLHEDVQTIMGEGLGRYTTEACLTDGNLAWRDVATKSLDSEILRPVDNAFEGHGGLQLLEGNLGRAVIKTSAVAPEHRKITAPCQIFTDQLALNTAFEEGELNRDVIVVMRFQGPRANGMPELHRLMPPLTVLQKRGFKVAIVTDGRMSGASGQVPAAIHVTPEALDEGPLARLRDGDVISLDAESGTLSVDLTDDELMARAVAAPDLSAERVGMGRELFAGFRQSVSAADQGASIFADPDA